MIKKFDHVGLAVKDSAETVALLKRLFGFEIGEILVEAEAGFKSTMISCADVTLELIEPLGSQGMIQKFIEKRGGGLHHVSIQVTDIDEEIKRLRGQGVQFVSEKPAEISGSRLVFIHPRSTNGLLIELIQKQ
jgi:methylmalonyl-CoA/ethylmalonyl-CoA epimerase